MKLSRISPALLGLATLSVYAPAQDAPAQDAPAAAESPFPPDHPAAHGVDPAKLEALGAFVAELCESEEVVGGELLVIKDGRTLLHEGYGWRDREAEVPMTSGAVFCVRSMTKPFVGTVIQMLAEEGALELDDPVAKYLPVFDTESARAITIEQLLWHTSGLPLTLITQEALAELDGVGDVAALGAQAGPDFEPGARFQYSDTGTDTLTAVLEVVSGVSAGELVRRRVLEPLGMSESTTHLAPDDPLRERACTKYYGRRGAWKRFWSPADEPLFPCFLGSQALYSTPLDYARFLELWMRRGKHDGERLLAARAVRRALEPGPRPAGFPTGFAGLRCEYGQLWQVWIDPEEKSRRGLVAFGHGGSDGTQAWCFPGEKLTVLFFTQSRGHGIGMLVEEKIDQLLRGAPFDPNTLQPELAPFLGLYQDVEEGRYLAVLEEGGRLALEIPGRHLLDTRYAGDERWKLVLDPRVTLAFERDADGAVVALSFAEPGGSARLERLVVADDLPSADELIAKVAAAHRPERLAEIGAIRLRGRIAAPARKQEGRVTQLYAARERYRLEIELAGSTHCMTWNGERAMVENPLEGVLQLDGVRREQTRLESFVTLVRDWRRVFVEIQPVLRVPGYEGVEAHILVRATPREALPVTLIVGQETGRLLGQMRVSETPTLGRIGVEVAYSEFREVDGLVLPFHQASTFPTPLLGTVTLELDEVETAVEVTADDFLLSAGQSE